MGGSSHLETSSFEYYELGVLGLGFRREERKQRRVEDKLRDVVSATAPSLWMGRRSGHSGRRRTPCCYSVRPRLGRNLHAGNAMPSSNLSISSSFSNFLRDFDASLYSNQTNSFNCYSDVSPWQSACFCMRN